MASHRRDPLKEGRERAREKGEGQELPDLVDPGDSDDVPAHPNLGAPPRRDRSRPVFRSSQLEEGEGDPPMRG
jgi:hypothetical protein